MCSHVLAHSLFILSCVETSLSGKSRIGCGEHVDDKALHSVFSSEIRAILNSVRILTCVISKLYLSIICRICQYLFPNLHRPCPSVVPLLHPVHLILFLISVSFQIDTMFFLTSMQQEERFREEVIRTLASIPVPEICILNCCLSQQDERLAYNSSASASHSVLCVPGLDYTSSAEQLRF